MAKVKAPLFGLGASGQIGGALVYMHWKGLDTVREYVIPANPKSTDQITQRGYLTNAVALIHLNQAMDALPMDEEDIRAYARWGSIYPTPRTWFNQAVKINVDLEVAGKHPSVYRTGHGTPSDGQIIMNIRNTHIGAGNITTGNFWYGTSKTALIHSALATPDLPNHEMVATVAGLTNGVKYYFQFRPLTLAPHVGSYSGIYHATPAA